MIGRAEVVSFPELGVTAHARIDTGAKTSSIWASEVSLSDGLLKVVFFGKGSSPFTGKSIKFSEFDVTVVSTSAGQIQKRYKVRLLVKLGGKKIRAWFTLADRSSQVYPVLIGRNILTGKFVVDVIRGQILKEQEQQRTHSLRAELNGVDGKQL